MTALVRHEDGKDLYYGANLHEEGGGFQWSICLESITDEEDGKRTIYDVLNRSWHLVGPKFETRTQGSKFLGFENGAKPEEVSKHWDQLIEEYYGLYSNEIETRERFNGQSERKFGRPSQGRTERLQVSVTPALKQWIESQSLKNESISQTVNRLLGQQAFLARNDESARQRVAHIERNVNRNAE